MGYNGTIITYGQTGSGKTYTIFGSRSSLNSYGVEITADTGVVARGIDTIFEFIE